MANQITGRIELIRPMEALTSKDGKTFYKRELVLDATRFDPYTGEPGFASFPIFEFGGDKCAELDKFCPGQVVTVSFDVQGVKYTNQEGKVNYFNRVRGYRIELREKVWQQPQHPQQPQQPQMPQMPQETGNAFPPAVDAYGNPTDGDDMPF